MRSLASFALIAFLPALAIARELEIRKVTGEYSKEGMAKAGSGSGIVIGPNHVLTNRHVVEDDDKNAYGGFNVYLGPDFAKKSRRAKVTHVCDSYDLAILELAEPVVVPKVPILDGVAPLATKVTAYGFPLGSRFGVALTASGGQVSRQPVIAGEADADEQASIKTALWHDALIAGGSSGGPLLSETGVLVGLNYAQMVRDAKYTLSVPSSIVAEFLRGCKQADGAKFEKSADATGAKLQDFVVYVEILSKDAPTGQAGGGDIGNGKSAEIIAQIKSAIPRLSDEELEALHNGDVKSAFSPIAAASIKEGKIARVRGTMTVIQIVANGMLIEIDGVRCLVALPAGDGTELSAKFGDRPVFDLPVDAVYVVGKAREYTTVAGRTSAYIQLYRIGDFITLNDFSSTVEVEQHRRHEVHEKLASERRAEEVRAASERRVQEERAAAEQAKRQLDRNVAKLRRTFSDKSGNFSIDAVCVSANDAEVELLRMVDKEVITVSLKVLSVADREWVMETKSWVRLYGRSVQEQLVK